MSALEMGLIDFETVAQAIGLAPRSALYNIEPIGSGTPLVESLTSYVTRLATAHSLHVGPLITHIILGSFGRQYLASGPKLAGTFWRKSLALNGTGSWAADMVKVLETLTKRNDLRQLTLLSWHEAISHRGLLRRTRAWCPQCLGEWKESSRAGGPQGKTPVYEPLIWALEIVKSCPKHSRRLRTRCSNPECSQTMALLAHRARPGHCFRCQHWLGLGPGNTTNNMDLEDTEDANESRTTSAIAQEAQDLSKQAWIGREVGKLLGVQSTLADIPLRDNLIKSLARHLSMVAGGEVTELARQIGLSRRSLQSLLDGVQIPQLDTLMTICNQLGQTPLALLTATPESGFYPEVDKTRTDLLLADPSGPNARIPSHKPKRKRKQRAFNEDKLISALQEAVLANEEPPPSMREVGKRLGYDASHLYKHFPQLCAAVSKRYVEYQKARRRESEDALVQEIRLAVRTIYEHGTYPTYRLTKAILNKPRQMYEPHAIRAWNEILEELGLKGKSGSQSREDEF
jgi:transcriptional regulator with XRE-family HTH domain